MKDGNWFPARLISRLARDLGGAATIEYVLLVFLIGMGLLVALESIGGSLSAIMNFLSNALVEGGEKAGF